jgi:hypothetical protein
MEDNNKKVPESPFVDEVTKLSRVLDLKSKETLETPRVQHGFCCTKNW